MSEEKTIHDKQVRWLILLILMENQRAPRRETGGWLRLAVLQRLLSGQGYNLTKDDIKTYSVYLSDPDIHCLEIKVQNDHAPFVYKYRITARGMRAATGEEKVVGVGLYS